MAAALGLTVVRELLQMRRPLTDLPPVTVPRRRADRAPTPDPATTPNCCASTTPRSPGTPSRAAGPRPTSPSVAASRGSTPRGLFMAFDERTGRLLGFHWTKVHDRRSRSGRGVRRRRRPGRAGPRTGRDADPGRPAPPRRAARALQTVMLYVEADNSAAVKTYQRLGFRGLQRRRGVRRRRAPQL